MTPDWISYATFVLALLAAIVFLIFLWVTIRLVRRMAETGLRPSMASVPREKPAIDALKGDLLQVDVPRNYVCLDKDRVNSLYGQIDTTKVHTQSEERSDSGTSSASMGVSKTGVQKSSESALKLSRSDTQVKGESRKCNELMANLITDNKIQWGADLFDHDADPLNDEKFFSHLRELKLLGCEVTRDWTDSQLLNVRKQSERYVAEKLGQLKRMVESDNKFVIMRNTFEILPNDGSGPILLKRTPDTDASADTQAAKLAIEVRVPRALVIASGENTLKIPHRARLTIFGTCFYANEIFHVSPIGIID